MSRFLIDLSAAAQQSTTGFRIKFSAEEKFGIISFAFQLIDIPSQSPNLVQTIGIAQHHMDYETLNAMREILNSCAKYLKSINFNGKRFSIEYFFVADLKSTRIVLGFNSRDILQCCSCDWKRINEKDNADQNSKAFKDREAANKSGASAPALRSGNLLRDIKPNNILYDPLIMKSRICDQLLRHFLEKLARLDSFIKGIINEKKHRNLYRWIEFINIDCNIQRGVIPYNAQNPAKFTKGFTGGDYDKILDKVDIQRDFPDLEYCRDHTLLWKILKEIFVDLNLESGSHTRVQTKKWRECFLKLYSEMGLTSDMHVMIDHLADQVQAHGDIKILSQQ